MNFFFEIIVVILGTYLAFTNYLADKITGWFPTEGNIVIVNEETGNQSDLLPSLPTTFSNIPDILIKSQEYQAATVIDSEPNYTINDPILALVNIYCTFTTNDTIRTTTGTGFFVHSDGVILTNAHVAQYLLLEKTNLLGEAECVVRTGNPATAKYQADLLYIPPAWMQKNIDSIKSLAPTGTGERDYALLYVSESINKEPLPARFPALALNTKLMPRTMKNREVQAAGYPATDLLKNGASSPLLPVSATTTISELYTFGSNYADVFSIRGTNVGAEGSSGGPVLNSSGEVVGVIVTRSNDKVDGKGSLRAITASHIDRTIKEETGFSLDKNISGDFAHRSEIFSRTVTPFLLGLLTLKLSN
ncbi:MAG: serine protease [Candidatus Paceibacterota bacterium]